MTNSEFHAISFWSRIDDLLYTRQSSLTELCAKTELSYGTIASQRNRKIMPKAETIVDIAKELGVTVEYLLTGEQDTTFPEIKAIIDNPRLRNLVAYLNANPSKLESILILLNK